MLAPLTGVTATGVGAATAEGTPRGDGVTVAAGLAGAVDADAAGAAPWLRPGPTR